MSRKPTAARISGAGRLAEPDGERVFTVDGAELSYRILVEAMSEGAATLAPEGEILYCNQALARLLGEPLEAVMGRPFRERVAPPSLATFDALAGQGGGKAELGLRRRAGGTAPVYLSLNEMRVDGARLFCIIVTDLTEQKRNEEALAAERLARAVIDQAAESIVVCDASGRIIRASLSAVELCGRSPVLQPFERAFQVEPLQSAGDGTGRSAAGLAVASALRGETVRGAEGRLVRPDGVAFDLQVSAGPIHDALGHLVGCVVTLTDITERRRYEAEREQLLGQVEQLVGRQKEALDARDEFLSIASHELKTPLTALHLHVEGMLRYAGRILPGAIAPTLRDKLAAIERQGRRITSLVNDLLDVSRLRAGRMELAREAVDLSEVAREVVERIRGEAALAGCELQAFTPPGIVGCWDRNRLDQVVTNLVSNAIKYGKGKPVSLRVECDGAVARLAVEDQGIGVAPEHHERIFQRFERAVSGAEFGGMGLGLWITREILRRLDGSVRVESCLGAGARFVVELPLARTEAADPDRGGVRNPQVERSGSA